MTTDYPPTAGGVHCNININININIAHRHRIGILKDVGHREKAYNTNPPISLYYSLGGRGG